MRLVRLLSLGVLAALLAGLLPLAAPAPVRAEAARAPAPSWYRYQGEPTSYDARGNQVVNCGPTSVAMAIQYARSTAVPIRDIRAFVGKDKRYTDWRDVSRSLDEWGVSYRSSIYNARALRDAISRGNIAIVALNMDRISLGADVDGRSTDPSLRTGRYETAADAHWIVVKGVTPDGEYFEVYDGNVWGGPGDARYWYADGTPKGLDRLYRASEVERAMAANVGGRNVSRGVEIVGAGRPVVESGQEREATVTYYTASYEETRKRPGDPGWGIMYNGNKVHWGAVAVDPEYIPLGTRMYIEGWGDQVFVAEDTGNAVIGWHVDIYWPGTRQQAFEMNDAKGGVRKITLLGPGPAFTDTAPSEPPVGSVTISRENPDEPSRWVTLALDASDSEERVVGMMISNNPYFTDAFEEPYAETRAWTLAPGDGEKTVYVRFKNHLGAWSDPVSASVDLAERPPVGSVVVAPDPRVLLSAHLSGDTMARIGPEARVEGSPRYRPLGPNLLANSSFERWAGGIPEAWDTDLREEGWRAFDPSADAHHGALALTSATGGEGPDGALAQKVTVKPGTTYTLSARVRGAGGALDLRELQTRGVTSRELRRHEAVPAEGGSEDWRTLSVTFRSHRAATDAEVRLSGDGVLWDALQLEEGEGVGRYRADGVLLEPAATNYVANGSAELGEDGWTGLNFFVDVVASPEYARYGRNALRVRKEKEGRAATFAPATLQPGRRYTYSVYVRRADGRPVTNDSIRGWYYQGASGPDEVDTEELTELNRPPMTWEPAGGGWYRGSYTFEATEAEGLYGVVTTEDMGVGRVYYLDGAQIEAGKHATSYIDGSLGEGYVWRSEPFAGPSRRARASVGYGATRGRQGSLLFRSRPEGGAPPGAILLELGGLRVRLLGTKAVLEAGGRAVAAAPWRPGEARAYAITWDGEHVAFWQDGRPMGAAEAAGPEPGSDLVLGPARGPAFPNAVVGDVSLWRVPLSQPEVAHQAANAPLDAGLPVTADRRTTVVTNASDTEGDELRIEWSEDGETWYPWEDVRGVHAWDLGPGRGEKTVWVRYTDGTGNWLAYRDTVVLDPERR